MRKSLLFVALTTILLLMVGCDKKKEPRSKFSVTIAPTELTLEVGKSASVKAVVVGGDKYTIRWEVSSSEIIEIDKTEGNTVQVSARRAGQATLTATVKTQQGDIATSTCLTTVTESGGVEVVNSELPLIDYNASTMDSKVLEYEGKLGRSHLDVYFPFEDENVPPKYGYFNNKLACVPLVVYDIQSLLYEARLLYAFGKEDPKHLNMLDKMLHQAGYEQYGYVDDVLYYTKQGEVVKISSIEFEMPELKDIKCMIEFIQKDKSLLIPKKAHAVLTDVVDLPRWEMLLKSEDEIINYENELGLREFYNHPNIDSPNLLFAAKDPQKTNLDYLVYFKNFGASGEVFLEGKLNCVESMADVESPEFIKWLNNCGYPVDKFYRFNINGEELRAATYIGQDGKDYTLSVMYRTRSEDGAYYRLQVLKSN